MKALGQGADGSPRAGCLLASGSEDALGLLLASTYGQRQDALWLASARRPGQRQDESRFRCREIHRI